METDNESPTNEHEKTGEEINQEVRVADNQEIHQEQQESIVLPPIADGPEGIGGWLILFAIGLIITPFRLAYGIITTLIPAVISLGTSDIHIPWLNTLVYGEIVINAGFALFSGLLLYYLFTKNSRFPQLVIIFLLSNVCFILLDLILAGQITGVQDTGMDSSSIRELLRSFIGAAIWVPYFIYSKRVKNTFVV
ncbi:MAG: DUF2569 domain-containing protein [Bacteroidetes bacterium]|nr:DUF2569 domain-containing protein [Bacteroidota bacterium]